MKTIKIEINKRNVYQDVAQQTSYIGIKKADKEDEDSYDRIFTTDEDRSMLERYFQEAANIATDLFKPFLEEYSYDADSNGIDLDNNYKATLSMPEHTYNEKLSESISNSLHQYFVSYIMLQWCRMTDGDSVEGYTTEAQSMLNDVKNKIYSRVRPKRN